MNHASQQVPFWHRAGSAISGVALVVTIASLVYNWFSNLVVDASGRTPHEIAVTAVGQPLWNIVRHMPDAVHAIDIVVFAASLLACAMLDSELRRMTKKLTRLMYAFVKPKWRSEEADAALATQLVYQNSLRPST